MFEGFAKQVTCGKTWYFRVKKRRVVLVLVVIAVFVFVFVLVLIVFILVFVLVLVLVLLILVLILLILVLVLVASVFAITVVALASSPAHFHYMLGSLHKLPLPMRIHHYCREILYRVCIHWESWGNLRHLVLLELSLLESFAAAILVKIGRSPLF